MSGHVAINKRTLEKLTKQPPARDDVVWDEKLEGFGVRISPKGRVVFVAQYRIGRRSRRITIGAYGKWTPGKARREAKQILSQADAARHGRGPDPADAARELREAITFRELVDEYMDKAKSGLIRPRGRIKKPGTVKLDGYRVKHLTAHFGKQPVRSITRADCQKCLEKLIAGRHGAARTYGLLGAMFTYAIDQGYIATNPAHGVTKPADASRKIRLEADAYRALGEALEAAEARLEPWQGVGAIRLLALTGARKGEVRKLMLSEIDLAGRCLRLRDSKSGPSVRPLGEPALRLLKALMNRPGRPQSPYLFPGRDPREPYNGLAGAWDRIVGPAAVTPEKLTPHGLRHAFAGVAHNACKLSEVTVAALLGHSSARSGTITRGYISQSDDVLAAAADDVSRCIWEAMSGDSFSAEIVPLSSVA